jgi:hypothetical protein
MSCWNTPMLTSCLTTHILEHRNPCIGYFLTSAVSPLGSVSDKLLYRLSLFILLRCSRIISRVRCLVYLDNFLPPFGKCIRSRKGSEQHSTASVFMAQTTRTRLLWRSLFLRDRPAIPYVTLERNKSRLLHKEKTEVSTTMYKNSNRTRKVSNY